ncbi:hypothetical protein WN48_06791 [Eufriesea mexicana]|nr:hypothetical protein WN48_06791 [Eufriesea mexicana]
MHTVHWKNSPWVVWNLCSVNKSCKHLVAKYTHYRRVETAKQRKDIETDGTGKVMDSLKSTLKLQVARKRS